jgi:hypothetical protein
MSDLMGLQPDIMSTGAATFTESIMDSFGYTPILSKTINLAAKLAASKVNTDHSSLHPPFPVPNEILSIILNHPFSNGIQVFISSLDPTTVRFLGDLSIIDANKYMRQTALLVLLASVKLISEDLLSGPVKSLSDR